VELQSRYAELSARGIGLAVVLYDPPEVLKAFADQWGIEYPLLSDVGSEVIQRYDILNREMEQGSPIYGIPYPGTFVLDNAGRVTDRFFEQRYEERFTLSSIALRLWDPITGDARDATQVDTDHLTIVSYASDEIVAPGNRFSLVLDVTPKPEMHVYAPGDHTYQVIRLRVTAPEFLQTHEVAYPLSETYDFEPLNETVPVYLEPFRFVQEITVPMSREIAELAQPGEKLTIEGTLEYQACDHEICYLPAEVPLSWELDWRPLVFD
jgi:hypothetical protein